MNNILKLAFVLLSTSLFSQTDNLGIPKLDREKIGNNPSSEVYESVDQDAEFPGSLNSFRNKISENINTRSLRGEGTIKATISFIIERDGSITDVKVNGSNSNFNKEAEKAVKSIKTRWIPAKINGFPVRQRYKFPLTMNFE